MRFRVILLLLKRFIQGAMHIDLVVWTVVLLERHSIRKWIILEGLRSSSQIRNHLYWILLQVHWSLIIVWNTMPRIWAWVYAQNAILVKSFLLNLNLAFIDSQGRFRMSTLWTVFLWSGIGKLLRTDNPWDHGQIFVVEVFIRNKLIFIHLFFHACHVSIAFKHLPTVNLCVKLLLVHLLS